MMPFHHTLLHTIYIAKVGSSNLSEGTIKSPKIWYVNIFLLPLYNGSNVVHDGQLIENLSAKGGLDFHHPVALAVGLP